MCLGSIPDATARTGPYSRDMTSQLADGVHLLVEMRSTGGSEVAGSVTHQDTGERQWFSSWLELLRLLEAAVVPT
jgi:hypothetical protein